MSDDPGCPLCRGATEGAHEAREMMLGTRESFRYGQCNGCGTLVLLDPPHDPRRYYPDDYYSLLPPGPRSPPVRLLKRLRGVAAARGRRGLARALGAGSPPPWAEWIAIAGVDRSAAICDIGCGSGELLFDLRAAGFAEAVGADPMVEGRLERDGVRIERATASELAAGGESGRFELVMLNHAFEHLDDPLGELAACRLLLAPGGTLMLRTPDAGSWAWRHYGTDWVGLDPPRHVFVPTVPGLKAAAAAAGLEPFETRWDSTEMQFWRSEQYRRDTALFEAGSHQLDPRRSPFSRRQLRAWRREAARLNRAGEGDTVAVYCRAGEAGGSG